MKFWKWLLLLAILVAGFSAIALYSNFEKRYPSTDNAYIDAKAVRISSQIEGPVMAVHVRSQERVKKGDLLLEIDARPYRAEVATAEAQLALARREVAENKAELASTEAEVEDAKVHLANTLDQLKRLDSLKEHSYSSIQQAEDAEAVYRRAEAGLKMSEARLKKARVRLELDATTQEDLLVLAARARLNYSQWEFQQARVSSPCNGILESVNVHAGETVRAHNALMLLVCTDQFWVNANFKETQLSAIRTGQSVDIEIDMYPDEDFQGVVESVSPASGTAFSLLPPENATGNWVKTTQRIPVKIRVLENTPAFPLKVGASAHVRIDTQGEDSRR